MIAVRSLVPIVAAVSISFSGESSHVTLECFPRLDQKMRLLAKKSLENADTTCLINERFLDGSDKYGLSIPWLVKPACGRRILLNIQRSGRGSDAGWYNYFSTVGEQKKNDSICYVGIRKSPLLRNDSFENGRLSVDSILRVQDLRVLYYCKDPLFYLILQREWDKFLLRGGSMPTVLPLEEYTDSASALAQLALSQLRKSYLFEGSRQDPNEPFLSASCRERYFCSVVQEYFDREGRPFRICRSRSELDSIAVITPQK